MDQGLKGVIITIIGMAAIFGILLAAGSYIDDQNGYGVIDCVNITILDTYPESHTILTTEWKEYYIEDFGEMSTRLDKIAGYHITSYYYFDLGFKINHTYSCDRRKTMGGYTLSNCEESK